VKKSPHRILILDGHPDPSEQRFVHALAASYVAGAKEAGHEVESLRVADLEFPLLRSSEDFQRGEPCEAISRAQERLKWCTHLVVLYPLWLGSMPALLKGAMEQVFRPGFAFGAGKKAGFPQKLLAGRSARVVVTMGMPGFFYRWVYRAHSLKSFERNILRFTGFAPIRATVLGNVETPHAGKRQRYLEQMRALGRAAK
jgi:putative NADPH-quinone reductase